MLALLWHLLFTIEANMSHSATNIVCPQGQTTMHMHMHMHNLVEKCIYFRLRLIMVLFIIV